MKRITIACLLLQVVTFNIAAQISPPGLDDPHAAFWSAIGFSEKLSERWNLTIYAGAARESNPDDYALLRKPAIFVLNQETRYTFNKNWSLSLCTSYRTQNRYEEVDPFEKADPDKRNEVRYYLRLYYRHSIRKFSFAYSFRPEFRTYYGEHGRLWRPVDEEVRLRLKAQVSVPLNASKSNQFILANEFLTATDHIDDRASHWTRYKFTENRLTTYFRHVFGKPSMVADLGIMHQLRSDGRYTAHLSVDLIFQNIFRHRTG
jgi:hypothetical protein